MAVEIAIDTNRYRDFVDAVPEAVTVFQTAPKIWVPLVVVAELRAGFAVGTHGFANQRVFEQFLHRPRVSVLVPTMETSHHYANLYRQLRAAGTPIPTKDLWIAAMVVQHDLTLFSRDAHFDAVPQIPTIDGTQ